MAWDKTLQKASFRGVEFEVASTSDDFEFAVVVHEYPYVGGASTEDMGRGGRRICLRVPLYGDDYEIRLQDLLEVLDIPGAGDLVHPVFGLIQVQICRIGIPHEAALPDQTWLSLEFIEKSINTPLFGKVLPVQQVEAVNAAADAAQAAAAAQFVRDVAAAHSLPALLRDQLSADMQATMDAMRSYCDELLDARAWVVSSSDYLNNPAAFVDDLTGGLVARMDALFSPLDLRPTAFGDGSTTPGYTNTGIGTVWSAPLADMQRPLLAAGDDTQPFLPAQLSIQQAIAAAGCAAQIFDRALDAPVLTPANIESIASDARTAINGAIAVARATYPDVVQCRPITEPLKALALTVTVAAEKLIRARPPLLKRTVDAPGNLQLIAFLWYGDYRRADELLRLNPGVRNPNFIAAGKTLLAYSA